MTSTASRVAATLTGVLILLVLTPATAMADCGSISYQAGGTGDPCGQAATLGTIIADTVAVALALGFTIAIPMLAAISQSPSEFSAAMDAATGQIPASTPTAQPVVGFSPPGVASPLGQRSPGGSRQAGDPPAGDRPWPSTWPHVIQRAGDWCGAACGEMAAGRLGVPVSQDQLAATSHFQPEFVVGDQVVVVGGFQTDGLRGALEEIAPVPGRIWVGGQISHDMSTPAALREVLSGYLDSSNASIILRVRGGAHWIVVDEVTAGGLIAIRDPGAPGPATVTAEQIHMMQPVGEAVFSFLQE